MEKFKEKRIVNICNTITLIIGIMWVLCLIIAIFNHQFLLGFLLLPCCIPFIVMSSILSDKNKYASDFLVYIRGKLSKATTLDELIAVEKEFLHLATDGKMYCLSYPTDLRKIHNEINSKIEILSNQKPPLTKQKLWEMAKVIADKQKAATENPTDKVDWNMLEEMWFDWLDEELNGE